MNQNFQILKDNGDGTFDIEVTQFERVTITHPLSNNNQKLTGASLVYSVNNWILENYPNTTGELDSNASDFAIEYGLDQPVDIGDVLPELLVNFETFPVDYNG